MNDYMDFFSTYNEYSKINGKGILNILKDLNNRLKMNSLTLDLNIYGGAAMCLLYDYRPATSDIDCLFNSEIDLKLLNNIIETMSEIYNLEPNWLNTDVAEPLSHIIVDSSEGHISFSNLRISIPKPEQLLAMKLLSARPEPSKDFIDATILCKDLNINTKDELYGVFGKYFSKSLLLDRQMIFINYLLEDLNNDRK